MQSETQREHEATTEAGRVRQAERERTVTDRMTNVERYDRVQPTVQVWVTTDVEGKERWHRNVLALLDTIRLRTEEVTRDWTDDGVRTLEVEIEMRRVTREEITDHEAMLAGVPISQEERVWRERESKRQNPPANETEGQRRTRLAREGRYPPEGPPRGLERQEGETITEYEARMQREVQSKPMTTSTFGSQAEAERRSRE